MLLSGHALNILEGSEFPHVVCLTVEALVQSVGRERFENLPRQPIMEEDACGRRGEGRCL